MFNSLPKHSGIYFVKDNINNLQIKINFRCIQTLLKLPKFNVPSCSDKNNLQPTSTRPKESFEQDVEECQTVIIKWQQKLLSPNEYELYSDLKNCTNDQQRKYFEIIKSERDSINRRDRRQTGRKKRQRKQTKTTDEAELKHEKGNFIFTYVEDDHFLPSSDLSEKCNGIGVKEKEGKFCEQMFIYVALQPYTQLVALKWFYHDRLLYIYPDFTDSKNQPYLLEIDSDYRHLYSYGIEDASIKALPLANDQSQFLYLPELPTHWRLEDDLSKKFEMPPKRTQRCAILFTISEVVGFEYDNVHIRYHIKLPDNTLLEEGLLDAASHTASSSYPYTSKHIGLTWQVTILCEEQFNPSHFLLIFFEIISIDSWQRERIEGYCHYALNLLQPCNHIVKLNCIRPTESFLESLNRYFIGGRRKFDYERFVCDLPGEKEFENTSNFRCRYGGRMQNSGELNLICQMLTQRNCELLNPCSNRTSGMTLEDIMKAYKEARRRLEAVTLN